MIIENKQNKLLERDEMLLVVENDKTPSYTESIGIVSKETKKPQDTILITKIKSGFGNRKFTISAYIYSSNENLLKYHPKKESKKDEQTPTQ